jgi:DNA-binding SARP family transcriptional activator
MFSIRLFGKLSLHGGDREFAGLRFGKLAELFCYLLVRRNHPQSREALASLLWGDSTTVQSKKYLRQALWQLQRILHDSTDAPVLMVDHDSVEMRLVTGLYVDLAIFESGSLPLQRVSATQLSEAQAESLKGAVEVYRGSLLEGWYCDWCLFERERLENLYLLTLEKLTSYYEQHQQYSAGLEMGERILQVDRAHERTHQAMMRMHTADGDRAGAIRQYQRCESALREELSVAPSRNTIDLLQEIKGDRAPTFSLDGRQRSSEPQKRFSNPLGTVALHLRRLVSLLSETQGQIEKEIEAIDRIGPQAYPTTPRKRASQR